MSDFATAVFPWDRLIERPSCGAASAQKMVNAGIEFPLPSLAKSSLLHELWMWVQAGIGVLFLVHGQFHVTAVSAKSNYGRRVMSVCKPPCLVASLPGVDACSQSQACYVHAKDYGSAAAAQWNSPSCKQDTCLEEQSKPVLGFDNLSSPPPVVQSGKKLAGMSTEINRSVNEVGTQSISPLLWAISSGSLEARWCAVDFVGHLSHFVSFSCRSPRGASQSG